MNTIIQQILTCTCKNFYNTKTTKRCHLQGIHFPRQWPLPGRCQRRYVLQLQISSTDIRDQDHRVEQGRGYCQPGGSSIDFPCAVAERPTRNAAVWLQQWHSATLSGWPSDHHCGDSVGQDSRSVCGSNVRNGLSHQAGPTF